MTRPAIHVLTLLALGCASTPEPRPDCGDPAPIALTIEATPRMNPDAEGRALPTELRLYQVRDASALEMASFEDVWQDAATVLGDALVSEETLTVYPEARLTRELHPSPEAQAIVAVVIVRQPAGRTWRAVVPMTRSERSEESCPALEPGRLLLRLDDYRVEAITPRRSTPRRTTSRRTTETRG
ncbi:type VI secretion system lipoprotein TssJ [Sandaracinus amylolyticus]|uniref:Type VI secretion lipoprotein/VasD n=1 Tax=Sandaracinus amylolyticus TaxID=927083 RepID=A0A0F6W6K9_9BACT|nr:type VI secretion system lipoprotein TssJ [Sandaracinus amylolyticus]AKF08818.1 Type VI secretion lipoprotein/VasD [Sandaracinus amylolyticus]